MPETRSNTRRGIRAERDLVYRLWRQGFAVLRGPASGAKAKHIFYPDVVAMYHGRIFVFEVKMRTSPTSISLQLEKLRKLYDFASRAGGEAYLAIKITSNRQWLVVGLRDLGLELDSSNKKYLTIPFSLLASKGLGLEEFVNSVKNTSLYSFIRKRDGDESSD